MLRNKLVSDRAQKIQRQLKIQYSETLELKDLLLLTTLRSPRYYSPLFLVRQNGHTFSYKIYKSKTIESFIISLR